MNNTLHKGLRLLEILARSAGPLGITELAGRASLGKSDVHRLMQSLVELGFARRESAHGIYAASTRMWELGTAMVANHEIRRTALPQMLRLAEASREAIHLTVLDGGDVVCLHAIDGPGGLQGRFSAGSRLPAHSTATGKAMLSTFDDETLDELRLKFEPLTDNTITDPLRLFHEVHRAREVGYALNLGEYHAEVCSVAAPIVGAGAIAALEIAGPADRLKSPQLEALGQIVSEAARIVGADLARAVAASNAVARRRIGRTEPRPGVDAETAWPAPPALAGGAHLAHPTTALESRDG